MLFHVLQVVLVTPANMALLVYPDMLFNLPLSVPDFSWKIDIVNTEQACINLIVDCSLIQHDHIRVIDTDMVNGLPVFDQRRNNVIDPF